MPWSASSLRVHVESALAGRVVSPFRFKEATTPPVVSTGIAVLDELTGGLPRGCLSEIYGPACSGRTSILQAALAARTQAGEACALVDATESFDPAGARDGGVFLPRLLWVRCRGIDPALRSVDWLLHGGGFGLVALDLGDVSPRLARQVQLNVWFRMRRAVEDTSTVLVVLAQHSNAKSCASLVLRVEKEAESWSLPVQEAAQQVIHTPGCLLDGSSHRAEMARSFLRSKKPLFIDRSRNHESSETARFLLRWGREFKEDEQAAAPEPQMVAVSKERKHNPAERNPG